PFPCRSSANDRQAADRIPHSWFGSGPRDPTTSSSASDRPTPRKRERRAALLRFFLRSLWLNVLWYLFVLLGITFEPLQTLRPELLIIPQPIVDDAQRFGVQLTDACCAFVFGHDQTDAPQQAKMF